MPEQIRKGRDLRLFRTEFRISKKDLATELGISVRRLDEFETGDSKELPLQVLRSISALRYKYAGPDLPAAVRTGRDLKDLRNHLGWTQIEIAHYLARSPSSISRFERDIKKPLPTQLQRQLSDLALQYNFRIDSKTRGTYTRDDARVALEELQSFLDGVEPVSMHSPGSNKRPINLTEEQMKVLQATINSSDDFLKVKSWDDSIVNVIRGLCRILDECEVLLEKITGLTAKTLRKMLKSVATMLRAIADAASGGE